MRVIYVDGTAEELSTGLKLAEKVVEGIVALFKADIFKEANHASDRSSMGPDVP